jgi:glucose-1-phosphate cytidylyltransferase
MANDFTLTLGLKKQIVHHQKNQMEDWKITFVDTGLETLSGGRVARIKDYIGKDEEFFYTYGDGLSDIDLNQLVSYHKKMKKTVTLTGISPSSPYGIIEVENGMAKTYKEKPTLGGYINGGFWVCNRKIFDYLSTDESCQIEGDPLITMTNKGEVAVYLHHGYWESMDTYKHVGTLNKKWESGQAPWKIWK